MVAIQRLVVLAATFGLSACGADQFDADDQSEHGGAIVEGRNFGGDPPVAALLTATSPTSTSVCTCTMVTRRACLTAAHCLEAKGKRTVYFGTTPFVADDPRGRGSVAVARGVCHPEYQAGVVADPNDIAVVFLAADAPTAARPINRANLNEVGNAVLTGTIRMVGFGRRDPAVTAAQTLRKREGTTNMTTLFRNQFEAGPDGSNLCGGDSGGPAFMKIGGREVIAGVASASDTACATRSIYVRVDTHLPFLTRVIPEL